MHGSYAGYFVYENLLLSELVLPYKSTLEAMKAHGGSRLYLLPPPEPVDGGRQIYVVGDLLQELSDFSDSRDGVRHASLRDFLDGFSMGEPLTVPEHPHAKPGHVMLSRVDPVEDEIWSFRCLAPAPGIRVLGRFAAKDCFIALDWDYRENIDGEEGWDALVAGCKSVWRDLFGNLPPHQGNRVNEYLSSDFYVVPASPGRKGSKRNV